MAQHRLHQGQIACVLALLETLISFPVLAQISSDDTLGVESSRITPRVSIREQTADRIDGGATRGSTLFHSFSEFNVDRGQRVYFDNPTGIQNIFARVTGENVSNILGTLGVTGSANLFLLNPNGIIFGNGARLDIQGSFVASTANRFTFSDGNEFSAVNPQTAPLLTIGIIPGLQYGTQPVGNIMSLGNLEVGAGQNLTLFSRSITASGSLIAYQGTIQLLGDRNITLNNTLIDVSTATVGAPGRINIQANQAVSLTAGSRVFSNVEAGGVGSGGGIEIRAGSLSLSEGSQIQTLVRGAETNDAPVGRGDAGNVVIQVSRDVTVDGTDGRFPSTIFSSVGSRAIGNGGDTVIDARSVYLTRGGGIRVDTFGTGNAGRVTVNARGAVILDGVGALGNFRPDGTEELRASNISGRVGRNATGNGDTIQINARNVEVRRGANISTDTFGTGNAGSVIIQASDAVTLSGISIDRQYSFISSDTNRSPDSDAGSIRISTDRLSMRDASAISSSTILSNGQGGQINIEADVVDLSGTGENVRPFSDNVQPLEIPTRIASATLSGGDAGNLTFAARQLMVRDGAIIAVAAAGGGQGGRLTIRDADLVELTGASASGDFVSLISADAAALIVSGGLLSAASNGGDLEVETDRLVVRDGAFISASTLAAGRGGDITIRANSMLLEGASPSEVSSFSSGIYAQSFGIGRAGNVDIRTNRLRIEDGAQVTVAAGVVRLPPGFELIDRILDSLEPELRAELPPLTANGAAGNLEISADQLWLDRGTLSARTLRPDQTGANILLQDVDGLLLQNGSQINASANNGASGGNVTIRADGGFVIGEPLTDNDITATADRGRGGNINIYTQGIFGIEPRPATGITSDIDASSEFGQDGSVILNTLDVDPTRGLAELPIDPVDASRLISQNCSAGSSTAATQGEFVLTGRGGLPPSPSDLRLPETIPIDWVTLDTAVQSNQSQASTRLTAPVPAILEAQGWIEDEKGAVTLVAEAPATTQTPYCSPTMLQHP